MSEDRKNKNVDSKYMHSKIKEVKGIKGCTTTNCIKSKEGFMFTEKRCVK